MICPQCQLELTSDVLAQCRLLACPNKLPINTSGKVNQLFFIEGSGFVVSDVSMLSRIDIDPKK